MRRDRGPSESRSGFSFGEIGAEQGHDLVDASAANAPSPASSSSRANVPPK